ncbi:MAG: phosphopantetheine-binding protein [Alcaligenes sp.]
MNEELAVADRVLSLLAAVLKCPVAMESSRENLAAWDSLKHIEVMFALEEDFDMQFSEEELSELSSVQALVERLRDGHEA